MNKNDVLERLGVTEADFHEFYKLFRRRRMLGGRQIFTVMLPFSVYEAYKEIVAGVKCGFLSREAADYEFDTRVRPHFVSMPEGYVKERGDIVRFDYERTHLD